MDVINNPMNTKHTGFTLVELLITLTIIGILTSMAMPSYREFIMNNRMLTANNDFIGSLAMARSEAVKRGTGITICSSNDQATCTGTAWNLGWIITVADSSELLRVHSALDSAITMVNSPAASPAEEFSIQYRPTGFLRGGQANTLRFCDSRTGERGRQINIVGTGRPSSVSPDPACS